LVLNRVFHAKDLGYRCVRHKLLSVSLGVFWLKTCVLVIECKLIGDISAVLPN